MKFRYFVLLTILFFSCSQTLKKPLHVDIFNPQYDLTFNYLSKSGFEQIPEDIPIMGIRSEDTLVYFQFDDGYNEGANPISMSFRVDNIKCNKDYISSFFENKDIILVTDYDCNGEDLQYFYAKNTKKNLFFTCSIDKISNQFLISFGCPKIAH